jgi:tetratricopeptide (TPR) repeat protein
MANTLVNLANARATLDGDETRALQSYERALAIYIRVHGEDHPRVADTMTNLANSHRIEGRLDHAIGLYARALEIYEAHYDHSDPRLGPVLRGLGTCHAAKGDARGEAILARARAVDPP